MGDYRILVEGHGMHHNNRASDADHLARELVDNLKKTGHEISKAEIVLIGSALEPEDISEGARPKVREAEQG